MMFDLGLTELLVIAAIAVLVVPPKDLPGLMRTVGRAFGKVRRMVGDFQRELNDAVRVDELKAIRKQVADIRRQTDAEFANDLVGPSGRGLPPAAPALDGNAPASSASNGSPAPENEAAADNTPAGQKDSKSVALAEGPGTVEAEPGSGAPAAEARAPRLRPNSSGGRQEPETQE